MSSCFNILIVVGLLILTVQARPERQIKKCHSDDECAPGFSCMHSSKFKQPICAKKKPHESNYPNKGELFLVGI